MLVRGVLKRTYPPCSGSDWIPLITRFLDAIRPITGQDISINAVDGGMKHELDSLRVQIDGLIQMVCVSELCFVDDLTCTTKNSELKTRLEQRTGSNQPKLNASSKGGNEVRSLSYQW